MSIKKEYYIENTHIILSDDYVRENYEEIILEHIVTAAKPALLQESEPSTSSYGE